MYYKCGTVVENPLQLSHGNVGRDGSGDEQMFERDKSTKTRKRPNDFPCCTSLVGSHLHAIKNMRVSMRLFVFNQGKAKQTFEQGIIMKT